MHFIAEEAAHEIEPRAFGSEGLDILRADVCGYDCRWLQSKCKHFALEVAAELAHIFVVGIQHRGASVRKTLDQLIFRPRDSGDRIEIFQMHGGNVGHHRLVGQRDPGQGRDLSSVRHSHLNHSNIVLGLEHQQSERKTKMIVEISLGAMHAVFRGQQMGHRFFGGGLAHRSGDADGRLAPDFSHCRCQRLQRDQGVVDGKQAGWIGISRQLILPHHCGNRAAA